MPSNNVELHSKTPSLRRQHLTCLHPQGLPSVNVKQQPAQPAHLSGQSQIHKHFKTFHYFITCLVGLGSPAR